MRISLTINGQERTLDVSPHETLLALLRREGYFGVKHGCEDGSCGACTVLVDGVPLNSCVLLVAQVAGAQITTIEGIGGDQLRGWKGSEPLHALQEAFIVHGATQCGFCTPGMLLTAKSLLDVGADVIAQHQDSPGPQEAAQEKGVYSIGYNSDMSKFAPKAQLTAPIWNWGPFYVQTVEQVRNGTWKSASIWWGMKEELVQLASISDRVPADVKALVEKQAAAIQAGTLHPFTGPVTDQNGAVQIAAGSTADDGHLLGMSYFVKGVQGTIPK